MLSQARSNAFLVIGKPSVELLKAVSLYLKSPILISLFNLRYISPYPGKLISISPFEILAYSFSSDQASPGFPPNFFL